MWPLPVPNGLRAFGSGSFPPRRAIRGGLWLTGGTGQRRLALPSASGQRQTVSATPARCCWDPRFQPRDQGVGRNPQGTDRTLGIGG
jgi:hypothetical protein